MVYPPSDKLPILVLNEPRRRANMRMCRRVTTKPNRHTATFVRLRENII